MQKRIEQLAEGRFEYDRPVLSFSEDKIEIEILEGKDYTGEFVITSANRVPMRGRIETSSERMECLTPQFAGEEAHIHYQFHSSGFVEGDIQKGEFYIICAGGEYNLSFVVSVCGLYAETSVGRIRNLNDFTELAKKSPQEAKRLFYSKRFQNIFSECASKERLLYEGLRRATPSGQKVEEFLVGIGRKKRVAIEPKARAAECYEVTRTRTETVELTRSHWGYVKLTVESDAPFLIPLRTSVTEEDFIGSSCLFSYEIREEALHAGRNYGRLFFHMPDGTFSLEVCAARTKKGESGRKMRGRKLQEGRIQLARLYIEYRLKRIVTGAWANQSTELLDRLAALAPEEELYPLMKAQALIANKQRQEAEWILDAYKRSCTDKSTPQWGYYLYLCTLLEREPSYVDRMAEQIELLFQKNPKSTLLFWILLFLKDSYYRSNAGRYRAIEAWMAQGERSPYLYLEAYYLLWQDPYLLGRLGEFEILVLNWAAKNQVLSVDIVMQIMQALPGLRGFHPLVYRILTECYRVSPKEEVLAGICAYLIRSQCCTGRFHAWYELGIRQELRLTGLYEAYLMSMEERCLYEVPKLIQMYFQYDSGLAYPYRARLFVNIIAGKKRKPELYQKYRRRMDVFAIEQITAGHIDENLAVIYEELFLGGMLNEELASRMADLFFTHQLTCENKRAARAYIIEEELAEPTSVPIVGGKAYFTVYTQNYVVILEDTQGRRFCESIPFADEPLLHPQLYLERCLALAPDAWQYLLYWYASGETQTVSAEQRERYLKILLLEERLSGVWKERILLMLLKEYRNGGCPVTPAESALGSYLKGADMELLSLPVRRRLTELLLAEQLYEKAYHMVQTDGYDYLDQQSRVDLLSYAVSKSGFEEDDFLLGFASDTFLKGNYNDVILSYLCSYYHGATKELERLWLAAGEFGLDRFELEERILTQMLETTEYTPHIEQIYDSYCAGNKKETLCVAYITYFLDIYLREDALVPSHVFAQVQERYLAKKKLNDTCRLGLLKYLSEKRRLTETQHQAADELLLSCLADHMFLSCVRKLPPTLLKKYHLQERFFLEYHTRPGRQIRISFRGEEEQYRTGELTEVYPGVYVREFLLFPGETIQYYLTEMIDGERVVTESRCISNQNRLSMEGEGRYAWLCTMTAAKEAGDDLLVGEQMRKYRSIAALTEHIFERM